MGTGRLNNVGCCIDVHAMLYVPTEFYSDNVIVFTYRWLQELRHKQNTSNEYLQYMFLSRNMKTIGFFYLKIFHVFGGKIFSIFE